MDDIPDHDEQDQRTRGRARRRGEDDVYSLDEEEDYRRIEEEYEAERRQEAVDEMIAWFEMNFEEPQNQTPWDAEDQTHVYVWGGPFDASDVLAGEFADRYQQDWIEAAVEQVQQSGTYEWAPATTGDFYEHADPDDTILPSGDVDVEQLKGVSADILARLERLEHALEDLRAGPPPIGHNGPPDGDALPPYDDEAASEVRQAIAVVRVELATPQPSPIALASSEGVLRRVGLAIAKWVARKLDIAVDEGIKAGISAIKWKAVASLMVGSAAGIAHYLDLISG